MANEPFRKHLAAIASGTVTKSNVIGIRKALSAAERRTHGYSESSTAPKISADECNLLLSALALCEPVVKGALVESGKARLRNPRYRRRFAGVAHIVKSIRHFRLVGFDELTPIYRACSPRGSFLFKNQSWQSGGDGPELVADWR